MQGSSPCIVLSVHYGSVEQALSDHVVGTHRRGHHQDILTRWSYRQVKESLCVFNEIDCLFRVAVGELHAG